MENTKVKIELGAAETLAVLRALGQLEKSKYIEGEQRLLASEAFNDIYKQLKEQQVGTTDDIIEKIWGDFHELVGMYHYYDNAYNKMTSEPIPPCFDPVIEPKYVKYILDGIYETLTAIETAYTNAEERSREDGEPRGQS